MFLRYYSRYSGQPSIARVNGGRFSIGRSETNDIVLQNRYVDPTAIEVTRGNGTWSIQAIGVNGAEASGCKLQRGQTIQWDGQSPISVYPYVFHLQEDSSADHVHQFQFRDQIHALVKSVHVEILRQLHLRAAADHVPESTEDLLEIERTIESTAAHFGAMSPDQASIAAKLAGDCVRDEILSLLMERQYDEFDSVWQTKNSWSALATAVPTRESELYRCAVKCMQNLFHKLDDDGLEARIETVEQGFWPLWKRLSPRLSNASRDYLAMRQLKKQLKDMLYGFGPLEDLLRIPTITEIMVNSSDEIFIEKSGLLQSSGRQFVSDDVTVSVIERIVGRVGRRIDTAQSMVDARLPDGSRVNAIIPPLAVKGPCLTIRKFGCTRFSIDKLIEIGSISEQVAEFLQACVRSRRSILVSGGTGTGKTTLLNMLSQAIPRRERIICIEDTHELQLDHPNLVCVECRDGNNEGKGKVVIRDLLKNALRQRPDRLIVGECRSEEALDMLQAMNTGHDGSMTTIHANSPSEAVRRLEVLVRHSGLPSDAIRQQIVSAVDVVVQLQREPNGLRRVSEVTQVVGYQADQQRVRLRTIFDLKLDAGEKQSQLTPTGCIPSFACDLIRSGGFQLERFLEGTVGRERVADVGPA